MAGEKPKAPPDGQARRPAAAVPRAGGVAAVALGAALLAVGLACGWFALAAGGAAVVLAVAAGLVSVLAARALGPEPAGRPAKALAALLPQPQVESGSWARLNQRGEVVERLDDLPRGRRGLYVQRSVTLSWEDALGFWRARRVLPSGREVFVPPAISDSSARAVLARIPGRLLDTSAEPDLSGVRAYEKGDSLRQISWKQTAHHGELMSYADSGTRLPPVLLAVDALGAASEGDADRLAATAAACLRHVRQAPDVLVADGAGTWRSPAQQQRFLASLTIERAERTDAATRARAIERLALPRGQERRRVLLVTSDPAAGLAPELAKGPLAASLATIVAASTAPAATPSESSVPEGSEPPVEPGPETQAPRRPDGATSALLEAAALLACGALGFLAFLALKDAVAEGDWHAFALRVLVATPMLGSLAGMVARATRARAGWRAGIAVVFLAAAAVAGVAALNHAFELRTGFGLDQSTAELAPIGAAMTFTDADGTIITKAREAEPVEAFLRVVTMGINQLMAPWPASELACWDLVTLLAAAGLAGVMGALATSAALRPALTLAPLTLAAVAQTQTGSPEPAEAAAALALGFLLKAIAQSMRRPEERASRRVCLAHALAVGLLACAVSCGGAAVAQAVMPKTTLGSFQGGASANNTQVNGIVDLSQSIRNRSSARVLTYSGSAEGLYLRLGTLTDFDGRSWEYVLDESAFGTESIGSYASSDTLTILITPEADLEPLPLGTTYATRNDDGSYLAVCAYNAPVTSASEVAVLTSAWYAASPQDEATEEALALPNGLPSEFENLLAELELEAWGDSDDEPGDLQVLQTLIAYFTENDFTYSLSVADDGSGNLDALQTFLTTHSGYCTHYATAFTLLARGMGLPARVVMGFKASDAEDAETGTHLVTMEQLHAWSEVWVSGLGWVDVDVTPASADSESESDPSPDLSGETGDDAAGEPAAESPATTDEPAATDEPEQGADASASNDQQISTDEQAPDSGGDSPATGSALLAWASPALIAAVVAVAAVVAALATRSAHRRRLARDPLYAWRWLCLRARAHGVRWPRSATEDQVADLIDAKLEGADAHALARAACLARYGTHRSSHPQ